MLPSRNKWTLCRCAPGDVRAAVLADVLRRTAGLLGHRVTLVAPDEDLLAFNVHPPQTVLVGHPDADLHATAAPWSAPEADPLVLRLALLQVPRDSPAHLTAADLDAARGLLERWRSAVATWAEEPSKPMCAQVQSDLLEALSAGDTVRAVAVLEDLERSAMPAGCRFETFAWADRLLGLDLASLVGR